MQTQPTPAEPQISSLDRTDVLPVLDVEAYEATLSENQKSLSRTDTWTVDALQDIDELIESATHEAPVEVRSVNVNRDAPAGEGFTVNVDRILKRIADLEADIVKAHEANAALQKRNEALQAERDEHAARAEQLAVEQARLAEHRALAEEMAQRSAQQLREEAQQLEARLKEADRMLAAEKTNSEELARRLAAKLSEHDKLLAMSEQHNRTVEDLVAVRDEIDERLQRELAVSAELRAKLSAAEESVNASRELLQERETALAGEGRKQAELAAQIAELNDSLMAEREAAQAQIRALTEERDSLLPAASELAARDAELERSAATIAGLRAELAAAQEDALASEQLARERADEIATLRAKLEEYERALQDLQAQVQAQDEAATALRAQLQTAHDECAIMAEQREKARARAKQLSQEVLRRDHKIEELKADLAVHSEALAAIRRDINRIGDKPVPAMAEDAQWILEPIEHTGEILPLTGTMLTVGRTAENDIALASKMVSRHHARLLIGPNGIIVEDAGSTNGCFVNGEQVKQHLMHDGDVLELGDLRYRLRLRAGDDAAAHANVVPLFEQDAE